MHTVPQRCFTAQDFRKSSFSDPDRNCVEVAQRTDLAQLRDSKTAFGADDDGRLTLDPVGFGALLRSMRA